jgi:hypothetical protein
VLALAYTEQGRLDEAVAHVQQALVFHPELTPIYDWYTEGFDTADLQDAKALLAERT